MPSLTVSLAQINVKPGNPRANWDKMKDWAAEAARRGSDLVIFPELWDIGNMLEKARDVASPLGGGLFAEVTTLSRSLNIHIIGSMLEKRGVSVCNSAALFSPRSGVLGVYRKIHLFGLMGEDQYLSPGESPLTLDPPWGRTSIAICYDLRFPELMRRYAVEGAKMLLLPAQWPHPRQNHWRTLVQARAIEDQMFVVACNCVGEGANNTTFFGHSMVVDPWGEILCEAGETEILLTVKFDPDAADAVRAKMPVLSDRRANVYG